MSTLTSTTPSQTRARVAPHVFRAELLKIWTTSSWWTFGVLMLVFTGLALLLNLSQAGSELDSAKMMAANPPDFAQVGQAMSAADLARAKADYLDSINIGKILLRNAANIYTSGQFFALLLMVILGALIVTNEFFHQTATTTFLTVPRRTRVIMGKLTAAVVLATAFWLVATVISVVVGSVFFSSRGHAVPLTDWPILRSVLFNLLAYVAWAVMGIG